MNVLFLTHRLPYAPNRGDRARAYHLLRILRPHARVTLVSLVHSDEEDAHRGDLAELTSAVHAVRVPNLRNLLRSALALPTSTPLTHTMLDAPALESDVLYVLGPPAVAASETLSGLARSNACVTLEWAVVCSASWGSARR